MTPLLGVGNSFRNQRTPDGQGIGALQEALEILEAGISVIGAALMIVDPEMTKPFFTSVAGFFVIIAVIVLITLGALVIRKIVAIDV